MEERVNSELEVKFKEEDTCIQTALNDLQATISDDEERVTEALKNAKAELFVVHKYSLNERRSEETSEKLVLETDRGFVPEWLDKPRDLKVNMTSNTGRISLSFTRNMKQEKVLKENGLENVITYKALLQKNGEKGNEKAYTLKK